MNRYHTYNSRVTESVTLYRLVFKTRLVLWAVCALAFSILLQPVDFIYANEDAPVEVAEPEPEQVEEEVIEEPEPEEEPEDGEEVASAEEESSADEAQTDTAPEAASEEADTATDNTETEISAEADSAESNSGGVDDEAVDTEASAEAEPDKATTSDANTIPDKASTTETDTDTNPSSGGGSSSSDDVSTTTEETTVEPPAATSTATTTEEASAPTTTPTTELPDENIIEPEIVIVENEPELEPEPEPTSDNTSTESEIEATEATTTATSTSREPVIATVQNNQNRYQFSEQECVIVGDGSYYCSTETIEQSLESDSIFAAKDSDGDMEIYARLAGEQQQITHNQLDDQAPVYDANSDTIVWHRLIDGRYQIMQYAFADGTETQLTFGTENSMEPAADDNYIVWQHWDGDDWEIVLFDGATTTQLTDNDNPDVSASIHNAYVLWTTIGAGGVHAAKVYEIETGATETIEGVEGEAVQNPRFVLVYDTKFDNGDIVTKGFDLESGVSEPISALPAELPPSLPDPEPVEETRALIQNKSSKEDTEAETLPNPAPEPEPEPIPEDDNTLDLSTSTSPTTDPELQEESEQPDEPTVEAVTDTETATTSDILPLTEYDLLIEPLSTSTQAKHSSTSDNLVE